MRLLGCLINVKCIVRFCIVLVLCHLLYLLYFTSSWVKLSRRFWKVKDGRIGLRLPASLTMEQMEEYENWDMTSVYCETITPAAADVDTVVQYRKLDFEANWTMKKSFWDSHFEKKYQSRKKVSLQYPLKVVLVPFIHNDPGLVMTFDEYYDKNTRGALNTLVTKMTALKNMTFIWSDILYLEQWWLSARHMDRMTLKGLVEEGRLEIVTGGRVMADEATTHIYGLLDQLIAGHEWIRNKLNVTPTSGWSIDQFGHGATLPYLLKASGVGGGAVIQRIHYAWKKWLAEKGMGDFLWRQNWDSKGVNDMLIHNQPFFHYTLQYSCGPDSAKCLRFDIDYLRRVNYNSNSTDIHLNVKRVTKVFLEQLGRTGSLYPHNVVLLPVGDDFRFTDGIEWDQTYYKYMELSRHIYENRDFYNAEVSFGTLRDYFKSVKERTSSYSTLKGDFFVYSDIFNKYPTYWSNFFISQSFLKYLLHELESKLRSAEILYSLAHNIVRQNQIKIKAGIYFTFYEAFQKIRRCRIGMNRLQRQDSVIGDFREYVILKRFSDLQKSIQDTLHVQKVSARALILTRIFSKYPNITHDLFSVSDKSFDTYTKFQNFEMNLKLLKFSRGNSNVRKVVIFNSHGHYRKEIIKLYVSTPNVTVVDDEQRPVLYQINPFWNVNRKESDLPNVKGLVASRNKFELVFVAKLPPLSLVRYELQLIDKIPPEYKAVTYCNSCNKLSGFITELLKKGNIMIENHGLRAIFNGKTGLLKIVTRKSNKITVRVKIELTTYCDSIFKSGGYDLEKSKKYKESDLYRSVKRDVVVTSGPLMTEVKVIFKNSLVHSAKIYNVKGALSQGIHIDNLVTIGYSCGPGHLLMRIKTNINNNDPPEFYTDSNGFQTQKRIKIRGIPTDGNFYPVTSHAYIQSSTRRLSVLVSQAQGVTSHVTGVLDVVLDREHGVNKLLNEHTAFLSKYIILPETSFPRSKYSMPSLLANHLSLGLLYPPELFTFDSLFLKDRTSIYSLKGTTHNFRIIMLSRPLPCDIHLMNLRTSENITVTGSVIALPSFSSLMILHRHGFSCDNKSYSYLYKCDSRLPPGAVNTSMLFGEIKIKSLEKTLLTGFRSNENETCPDIITIRVMEIVTLKITFA